ncbi:MAG: bifunctional rhamnulose-1-phosphate aldolase/short-chain dehydrogenase [Ignavibacteria bacterium]|nr:bifunctional rhamnulose-1-phosphate aldolase/short-chain dehydrogenase [Ignavibacteria bacterium]
MKNLWSNSKTKGMNELELLIYRSNILGEDPSVTNWAGGNTSAKIWEQDFRGRPVHVLRVKGSGTDLRTITRAGFPGLNLEPVLDLRSRKEMSDEEMVEYLAHTLVDLNAKRPSIDTLIHAFIDHPHIDHMHPDSIIALCTSKDGPALMRKIYGDTAAWLPWLRPGFELARQCGEVINHNHHLKAVLLGKHGLITWGATARESYESTISVIADAQDFLKRRLKGKKAFGGPKVKSVDAARRRDFVQENLPTIRGGVSRLKRAIVSFDDSPDVLEFVNSRKLRELAGKGAACPDHLVSTKLYPLVIEGWDPKKVKNFASSFGKQLARYVGRYARYFTQNKNAGDAMYDPYPRIILIPGIGMIATGKDKAQADIARDIYHRTIAVIKGASTVSTYVSMTPAEAYSVEYWPLEIYKLSLAPPEKSLSRRVALITGAASGIGRETALRFAAEGAHIVVTDLNAQGAREVAAEIERKYGKKRALAVSMNVTREADVRRAFAEAVAMFGGVDIVMSNAGISSANPVEETTVEQWERQMDILGKGYFLVGREGFRVMKQQGIGGSIIFIASKNALASGKNATAYSSAKAAELHLARCLAEEGGKLKIRVNTVCPDAVLQGSSIWSGSWRKERAQAYGIRPDQLEEFYRNRTLLGESIFPSDIAEAALYFASDRALKTTGGVLTVDGGVSAAFVR